MALDVTKAREVLEQPRGQQPAGCDQVAIERATLRALIALLEASHAALAECEDYFDQRADADCVGDPQRYVGNAAMSMLGVVRAALAALRAAGIGTGGRDAEAQG